jgi:hypothetical protein
VYFVGYVTALLLAAVTSQLVTSWASAGWLGQAYAKQAAGDSPTGSCCKSNSSTQAVVHMLYPLLRQERPLVCWCWAGLIKCLISDLVTLFGTSASVWHQLKRKYNVIIIIIIIINHHHHVTH